MREYHVAYTLAEPTVPHTSSNWKLSFPDPFNCSIPSCEITKNALVGRLLSIARDEGIEPPTQVLETYVIPLNQSRPPNFFSFGKKLGRTGLLSISCLEKNLGG